MMVAFTHIVTFTSLLSTYTTEAARILGIFPMPAKSHHAYHHAIMKTLHAAGHNITMVAPFPPENEIENFTYIDSKYSNFVFLGQSTINSFHSLKLFGMMDFMLKTDIRFCGDVIKLKEIQEALQSNEKPYDIIFTELRMTYECYLPLAEKWGIPMIGTISIINWRIADYIVGTPYNPSVIPFGLSTSCRFEMNFFERIQNLWEGLILDYYYMKKGPLIEEFHRTFFPTHIFRKEDIKLVFYNNHPSIFPRSVPANAIEIGGFHIQPASPLPQDIQEFIDGALRGVILFSFGSVVKAATMSLDQRNAFVAAFASIPQRVIWKYEEPIENLPKSVMVSKWIPQRDILEHKNVILFMSHCGQSGVYEAIITGTPIVTIPLFGDQTSNAAHLHRLKVGVHLDIDTVTKESILAAINTIIIDTGYHQRMQELSDVFKDRPMSPQESIVYWTEYVIKHNGTSHLRVLGANMPLYKYLMLDVLALALIVLISLLFIVYKVTRTICGALERRLKYEMRPKKD